MLIFNLLRQSMTESLTQLFKHALKIQPSNEQIIAEVGLNQFSSIQQAQIRQWLTLSQRFPETLKDLNDGLRPTTYLLGGQEPTFIDSVVLARAEDYLAKFSDADAIANRHVVRWADLLQHVLSLEPAISFNLNLDAPREQKIKEKKTTPEAKAKEAEAKKKKEKQSQKDAAAPATAQGEGEKKPKAEKKAKADKPKKEQPKPAEKRPVTPGLVDLRVGFIQKAIEHPDADSLYVSTIDVGEEAPRTICSGLRKFVPIEDMQQRYVVVVANLKPVKMRGISSNGMVLCASNKGKGAPDEVVEFVNPPNGCTPGDKLFFEGYDEEPEPQLNPKKKIFETIQPGFTTLDTLEVVWRNPEDGSLHKLTNSNGEHLKAKTLTNAVVS